MIDKQNWRKSWQPARLGLVRDDGSIQCNLSPRRCVIKEGRNGFCGVRGNRDGALVTMNFGKSVHITEETIETEAVNHFAPGERILSLGNIGCMLNCAYCHNWKTSQARYASDRDIYFYTPEEVVATAKRHDIRVLSWTYNDPVVWHEFVLETSRLAKQEGLINLYKSAFFITPEAVEQLLDVIDIFSVSIKAIDERYYRRYTTGQLQPVLDATRMVHQAGKHLEVSTLMITDISDDEASARKMSSWVLEDLDADVPLHFVRFHPDYKMRDTIRTPISRLIRAREIALGDGVKHVYLGNVYGTPYANSHCRKCGGMLIDRYGLRSQNDGLTDDGSCMRCGSDANIKTLPATKGRRTRLDLPNGARPVEEHIWHGDIQSIHVQAVNTSDTPGHVLWRTKMDDGSHSDWVEIPLQAGDSYRFIVARSGLAEIGAQTAVTENVQLLHSEVFDRAHFPTQAVEEVGRSNDDTTPLPRFEGNQFPKETETVKDG